MAKILYQGKPCLRMSVVYGFGIMLFLTLGLLLIYGLLFYVSVLLKTTLPDFISLIKFYSFVFLIGWILCSVFEFFSLQTYVFTVSDELIVSEGGLIWKFKKVVPLKQVTSVAQNQYFTERLFNVWSVLVNTAGNEEMVPALAFFGLKDPEKPKLLITKLIK